MEKVQEFPVPVDELWSAVSDADGLAGWLGDELELDVRPGGQGRVVEDGEVRRIVVEDVDPGRRLSFTWWPETPVIGAPTLVDLLVEAAPGGSRLIVRESIPLPSRWATRLCLLGLRVDAGLRC